MSRHFVYFRLQKTLLFWYEITRCFRYSYVMGLRIVSEKLRMIIDKIRDEGTSNIKYFIRVDG